MRFRSFKGNPPLNTIQPTLKFSNLTRQSLADPSTIHEHYSKDPSLVTLHVLPDEIFEKRHIKDAVNA